MAVNVLALDTFEDLHITPTNAYHWYSNQDFDEASRMFGDLQRNPSRYLTHADALIRCHADWTLEYFGIRSIRPSVKPDHRLASDSLRTLYRHVRRVSTILEPKEANVSPA